tara:strand:+ start:156 stop:500 length:345 start_codon:yes stop_codon:yes gene_type:complete
VDVTKIVKFDIGIKWKRQGGDNPYAMVFNAKRIWRFTQEEDTNKYTYMKLLIQDNAVEFRWGLHKQKKIMVYYHRQFVYFVAPPNFVYKIELPEEQKKKRKVTKKNTDKNIFVK